MAVKSSTYRPIEEGLSIGTADTVEGHAYRVPVHVSLTGGIGLAAHLQWHLVEMTLASMRRQYAPARMEDELAFVFKAFSEPWQPDENVAAIMKFDLVKRKALREACATMSMPDAGLCLLINGR